jgi:hypothetical protein
MSEAEITGDIRPHEAVAEADIVALAEDTEGVAVALADWTVSSQSSLAFGSFVPFRTGAARASDREIKTMQPATRMLRAN